MVAITWRTTHLRTRDNDNLVDPQQQDRRRAGAQLLLPASDAHGADPRGGSTTASRPTGSRRVLLDCAAGVDGRARQAGSRRLPALLRRQRDHLRAAGLDRGHRPGAAHRERPCRARVWEEFRREGIVIPYPIQTLEIARRPRPRQEAGDGAAGGPLPARLYVAEGPERGRPCRSTAALRRRSAAPAPALSP